MKKPVVALVGRPNVGKSTIFNRLVGKKISIIEDTPGITRDRIYGTVTFNNRSFHLIDTGGIDLANESFNDEIKVQAELAIEEADIVLFVVDGKEGLTSNDFAVRDILLKTDKKVIVVINKCDSKESRDNIYDFYELGFDNYMTISGEQNEGIWDLEEEITKDYWCDFSCAFTSNAYIGINFCYFDIISGDIIVTLFLSDCSNPRSNCRNHLFNHISC